MIHANVVVPLLALVTGWAALFPVRRELGPWLYHLLAFLVGSLAWPVAVGVTTLLGTPLTPLMAIVGHVVLVAVVAGTGVLLRDPSHRAPVPAWTFAAWGAAATAAVLVIDRLGRSAIASDSFLHFELSGMWLVHSGRLDALSMGSYGPLVPAMHAVTRTFGGQWTFSPYPVFSLTALALLCVGLAGTAFRGLAWPWRTAASILPVALLAFLPMWRFQTFFVHSNMVSAALLLASVVALLAGAGLLEGIAPAADGVWFLVSGLCAIGMALARPDGIAYAVVVLVVAAVLHARRLVSLRAVAALYGGFLLPALLVFGPAFLRLGLWESPKLPGSWALALLAAVTIIGAATSALPRLAGAGEWLARPGAAARAMLVANLVVAVALTALKPAGFLSSAGNMVGNLFSQGGWGLLWYAVAGIVAVSMALRPVMRLGERESLGGARPRTVFRVRLRGPRAGPRGAPVAVRLVQPARAACGAARVVVLRRRVRRAARMLPAQGRRSTALRPPAPACIHYTGRNRVELRRCRPDRGGVAATQAAASIPSLRPGVGAA